MGKNKQAPVRGGTMLFAFGKCGKNMRLKLRPHSTGVPNMIPTIDILFQLVIFFILVCRFSVFEQFPVPLPDKCAYAKPPQDDQRNIVTVTVMKTSDDQLECAVGDRRLYETDDKAMAVRIAHVLNEKLENAASGRRTVCLRIAKDIPFEKTQYALAAVAQSTATDIQIAVLKN
jgi:biopolymer transport protein ExbD